MMPYITVTSGLRGYFAVLVTWDEECGYVPWCTSPFSHDTPSGAEDDAAEWAAAEGIEYLPSSGRSS